MLRGFTMGTFDKLHIGHLELFNKVKSYGCFLTVGIINDNLVADRKGRQPSASVHDRAARVAEVPCVDAVVKIRNTDLGRLWEQHRFDMLFVGDDWGDKIKQDSRWQLVVFPRTPNISTTIIRGDVRFPLIASIEVCLILICLLLVHFKIGLIAAFVVSVAYFFSRWWVGRIRVHDWISRNFEEDASWC